MTYIKLDDLELIKRIDKDSVTVEIRSVHSVFISGRRKVVELKIPSSKGNVLQDLGRDPLTIKIDGKLIGSGSTATLNEIRAKFESGEPVAFASDIGALEEVSKIVVENLTIQFIGGLPQGTTYSLLVREFSPLAHEEKEEGVTQSQEEEAEDDIKGKTREVREGAEEGGGGEEDRGKEEGKERKEEEGEGKVRRGDERPEGEGGGTQERSDEDGRKQGAKEEEGSHAAETGSGSDQVSEQGESVEGGTLAEDSPFESRQGERKKDAR